MAAVAVAAFACAGGVASASGGGMDAHGGGTGASLPNPPALSDVACLEKCASEHSSITGGSVALTGRGLAKVSKVTFSGNGAPIVVKPDEVTKTRVVAKVPASAKSGKPKVADRYGQSSKSPIALRVVDESQLPPQDGAGTGDITVTPSKAFFDQQDPINVTYLYKGDNAGDVRIELVDRDSGSVVKSWVQQNVPAQSYATFSWDGLVDADTAAPSGNYKFRVGPNGGELEDGGADSFFSLYDDVFPIRGKHSYGDGVGAPRKGHTHEGQDVMANCGTPLVAARGGRVQYAGYQGAAGNYLVIDGRGTGRDYAYMHLRDKVTFEQGDRVYTGQQIGVVGQTGDATACHLHFELWSAPGWYEGGTFLKSVTRELKKWDSWS